MNDLKPPVVSFQDDLEESIEVIRANVPADGRPYYGLFSGGKDSVALKEVTRMAGVPVEWHYNVTTFDPPELVRWIRREHTDVKWLRPRHGPFFIRAAEVKGFPTRRMLWCCDEYKERRPPKNTKMLMGIRAEESAIRARSWDLVMFHKRTNRPAVNPLFRWDAEYLWDFIKGNGVAYSSLYDDGFHRLGCIGCPRGSAKNKAREFERWPRYEAKWKRVFRRTWDRRHGTYQKNGRRWFADAFFTRWEDVWDWWVNNRSLPKRLPTPQEDAP
jgi:phosphoadenosine phosphosulfate reductase